MSTSYLETPPPPNPLRSYGGGPVIRSFRRIPEIPYLAVGQRLGAFSHALGAEPFFWILWAKPDCVITGGVSKYVLGFALCKYAGVSKYEVNTSTSLKGSNCGSHMLKRRGRIAP